ncbi:MAG TPA: LamG-like jellyroll fold domain-containing protein [Polyangiaceae bacterium]|nr:LamG-like jellyroll fold domain-containing protein [Polyangiaceae bacterium]
MVRARLVALLLGGGAVAVGACGRSADHDAAQSSAGRASTPAGGNGASAGRSGTSGAAGGAGTGATGGGGATHAAGTSGSDGASSGASGRSGAAGSSTGAAGDGDAGMSGSANGSNGSAYDALVLGDGPVLYFAMNGTSTETDLTDHGHDGTYQAGTPARATLPNGELAADFDGVKQYLTVPSASVLSIPATHELTWEAWIRPDVLEFTHATSDGYVDWMGKCAEYSPTCEWEARLYSMTNPEDRCNRSSAYAFNPDANLGSGAFWQQTDCGASIQANGWYHVVGEYTTLTQPAGCDDAGTYPGSVDLWVNGVNWHQASHGQTGCMSQYQIVPVANDSPLNIGTMAYDSWFQGAVGKVAIYDTLLSDATITRHYTAMTGKAPTGSCADTCSF